ncbi:hypothetical protein QYF48_06955 [Brevibacillus agri]|uniref:hypothetical protein n=1 Tax=Brevibacillus agri TaxID=51101 RepID=UPI0025B64592|nr:hypothetical protein [Brevibacillus agri]MDN4092563.1 hypothetical protein [Brevibacillus agri]
MSVNGEKKNHVTVKMNCRFWDEKRETIKQEASVKRTPKDDTPRVKIQGPPIPFHGTLPPKKENDAWERMMQLRGAAQRETSREPGPILDDSPELEETQEQEELLGAYSSSGKNPAKRFLAFWPKTPIWRTVLTTGGAVAIGLLFGFLVLSVFTQEEFSQSYGSVLSETVQTLTAQEAKGGQAGGQEALAGPGSSEAGAGTAAGNTASGEQQNVSLQVPQISMFVAQAGVFQPDASPQSAVEPLAKAGIPHLLYKDGSKQYMFAAAAPTRDAVLGFAASLKNKGMDVYVKEFAFPAFQGAVPVSKPAAATEGPNVQQFFDNGVKLAQALSAQSGLIITSGQLSASAQETADLKEWHRQFLEESRLIQVQDAWKPLFEGMVNGINQALAARDKMAEASAGKKGESAESYAWQVQAGVLGYLESYASWVQLAR